MGTTLIITGGKLNIKFVKEHIKNHSYDIIIAVDKGLEMLNLLEIEPDYIIGDFDSVSKDTLKKYNKNIIKLNKEKDYTDTHMALKLALDLKSHEIVIIGAIGTRIDHTISNIHILKEALQSNVKCSIINEKNKIFLADKLCILEKDKNYRYISIIPLTTNTEGVTLNGLKYLLNDAKLSIGQSIGISNEFLDNNCVIEVKSGILIIIQSKD